MFTTQTEKRNEIDGRHPSDQNWSYALEYEKLVLESKKISNDYKLGVFRIIAASSISVLTILAACWMMYSFSPIGFSLPFINLFIRKFFK